ncbi:MAG TPA: chromate efflux transporter, partial [Steroidobacteraceae bacterium]|nr:chromate efflux transporter [Steroidobacteraceae bacterium]
DLHGLRLVAVAVVAQAVWGMARPLSTDRARASIGVGSALIVLFSRSSLTQVAAIVLGAVLGRVFCKTAIPAASADTPRTFPVSRRASIVALAVFVFLLVVPPLLAAVSTLPGLALFNAFYRSGALVFGGGHVVLPLLREAFIAPGWIDDDAFLAGYGAAQAVPGPLFTFAAYLGAMAHATPHGLPGALLGVVSIFLPGLLILVGTLPYWQSLRQRADARAMMAGVQAAVVGLLGAALYEPLWTSSVRTPADFGLALLGFLLLTVWRAAPLLVVLVMGLGALAAATVTSPG